VDHVDRAGRIALILMIAAAYLLAIKVAILD
jgi:hypothetical protein